MGTMSLPKSSGREHLQLEDVTSVVLVGANGAGKSRLGAWIEVNGVRVRRVSAQRALMIGDFIQPQPLEMAARKIEIGTEHATQTDKWRFRWNNNLTGHMLNDYEDILAWLMACHTDAAVAHLSQVRSDPCAPLPDATHLETVLRIWREVMPQRTLSVGAGKVMARFGSEEEYKGSYLSDGERATLYLAGQCLAAPKDGVIVIDEPELHLHQAIQAKLWDQIEATRPDCVFVYITHDLGFAASRPSARKIWVRSYDGKTWDWEFVPEAEGFPEPLMLQVIGSRRPILFVEGDGSSLDLATYRILFPERLVIPRGGCQAVVMMDPENWTTR